MRVVFMLLGYEPNIICLNGDCIFIMPPCVALCASHIDNQQRLSLLKCSIDSMLNQTHPVPIWISISTPWDSLDITYQDIPNLHIFIHTNEKYIFNSY